MGKKRRNRNPITSTGTKTWKIDEGPLHNSFKWTRVILSVYMNINVSLSQLEMYELQNEWIKFRFGWRWWTPGLVSEKNRAKLCWYCPYKLKSSVHGHCVFIHFTVFKRQNLWWGVMCVHRGSLRWKHFRSPGLNVPALSSSEAPSLKVAWCRKGRVCLISSVGLMWL